MRWALSTNWNSARHEDGRAMLEEILGLGFDAVELGYSLTFKQSDAVRAAVSEGLVSVTSVHAFCPDPLPDAGTGPEPFCLCDKGDWSRVKRGLGALLDTARFAAEVGASRVVVHAGRTNLPGFLCVGNGGGSSAARALDHLVATGKRATPAYEKALRRYLEKRDRAAARLLPVLRQHLDAALPEFEKLGLLLCLENLPTADGLPNEPEMDLLLREYEGAPLAYWHDMGHGGRRQALGLLHVAGFLKRIGPRLGGFHVHDVREPLTDHQMPGATGPDGLPVKGLVRFADFAPFVSHDLPFVLEPTRNAPADDLVRARTHLSSLWGL